jgi:hypothetical protein
MIGSVSDRQFFTETKVGGVKYLGSAVVQSWRKHIIAMPGKVLQVVEAHVGDHMDLFSAASPSACSALVRQVVLQTLTPNPHPPVGHFGPALLGYLRRLLDGLAVVHSPVGLLPMSALTMVRDACRHLEHVTIGNLYGGHQETALALKNRAPEVAAVLQSAVCATIEVRRTITIFMLGLCDKIDRDFGLAKVEPPPFERIPYSYDPPHTGVALYFTESGQQGRYPKRWAYTSGTARVAARARKQETAQCHKEFQKVHHRTGGVFRCGSCLF